MFHHRKKFHKVFAFLLVIVFSYILSGMQIKANELDGVGYDIDESLREQLMENAIPIYPNPKSKSLTLGYAAEKIKEALESDENAYIDSESHLETVEQIWNPGHKVQFIGGNKRQRKALKWAFDHRFVRDDINEISRFGVGKSRTIFNADQILTRDQLFDLLSRVMGYGYGGRIPFLKWLRTGQADLENWYESWMTKTYDHSSLLKSVGYIPQGEDDFYCFHLTNCHATREDLDCCLKNIKILAASDYTAKVIYRKTPLKEYTDEDAQNDTEEMKKFLLTLGLEYEKYREPFPAFVAKSITSDKRHISVFDLFYSGFKTSVGVNYGYGPEKTYETFYDPLKVDIVETFKEIITKRG
ncbi:MAG: hypothetical protein IKP88_17220 [Lachnospiraceae bacterium]|nr:hypothetical protein [Lachnospiraceae bacterium]